MRGLICSIKNFINNRRFIKMMKKVNPQSTNEYGFYSKKLQKPFDTLDELIAAEEEVALAEAKKAETATQKKADASKVEEAFKEMNAAKKAFNTTVDEASKIYAEEMKAAKDKYVTTVDQAEVAYLEAEKKYKENLKAFSDKYGNFHMTLKDGDVVTSISQQNAVVDPATEFLKSIIKMFNL